MNRPDNLSTYNELDLKLGIKSSLPHVKSTLALSILLWECADRPAELIYSEQQADGIVMPEELSQWVIDHLSDICEEERIDFEALISGQSIIAQIDEQIVYGELDGSAACLETCQS